MRRPQPIDAVCEGQRLRRVRVERRWLRVRRVLETWVIQGAWWHREERRLYARVLTDRAVVEVFHRRVGQVAVGWYLARVVD